MDVSIAVRLIEVRVFSNGWSTFSIFGLLKCCTGCNVRSIPTRCHASLLFGLWSWFCLYQQICMIWVCYSRFLLWGCDLVLVIIAWHSFHIIQWLYNSYFRLICWGVHFLTCVPLCIHFTASWKSSVKTVWPNNRRRCLMSWRNLVKGKLVIYSSKCLRQMFITLVSASHNQSLWSFLCVLDWYWNGHHVVLLTKGIWVNVCPCTAF